MNIEAQQARANAIQFECKLDGMRRNQDGTVKLALTVNPSDFPKQLMTDDMGQRYVAVLVAVNDDETPKVNGQTEVAALCQAVPEESPTSPPATYKPWKDRTYYEKADSLCKNPEFWKWAKVNSYEEAANKIKVTCDVQSRKDIEKTLDAMYAFDRMDNSFEIWTKYGVK